ncbi:MAG: hypothetical protein Q4F13_14595 [Pseudomonadota bacterium]|nr:hypothetical protein [Pseudomonadota bacterium]
MAGQKMRAWLHRARVEGRDVLELVLLPGLAAVLPWRLCFALFRRLSRWRWLYRQACEQALQHARALGQVSSGDEARWLAARRLVTLVDHADYYLGRFRGDGWMRRHLDVSGAWPNGGEAAVLCTFHWGAGMWGLRHAAAAGMRAHALVASLDKAHFKHRRVLGWYARARTAEVTRALGRDALDVSASLRPVIQVLRRSEQVLAAVDVPSDEVSASEEIALLGMRARVPRGLLRLAAEQRRPVVVYLTGLRYTDGRRFLRIHRLEVTHDLPRLMTQVFALLQEAMLEDGPAWHFWSEARRFFVLAQESEPAGAPAQG